jgi:hypothetical protein
VTTENLSQNDKISSKNLSIIYRNPDETMFLMLNAIMSSIGLSQLINQVSKSKDLDGYIAKITELLAWICEVERCTLYLYNNEKGCLYIKASSGRVREPIEISTKKDDFVVESFIHGKMIMKNTLGEGKILVVLFI